jgi:hypothetical protein
MRLRDTAAFVRSCPTCRGAGEIEGNPDDLRAWINDHEDLVIAAAALMQAHQRHEATWAEVERAGLAVDLHRLVAPADQCEQCNGMGRVHRLRRRRGRRQPW